MAYDERGKDDTDHLDDEDLPDNITDFVPVFSHRHPEVSHVADAGYGHEQFLLSEGLW